MEEQKTIKDYIVDYLLDGEDEKRLDPVLVEWLAEDESHRKEFNLYKKIWEESHRYTEVEAFDPDLAWEKVDKINRQKVYLRKYWKNMLYTASGVAASLLIVLALSFMGTFQKGSEVLVSMSADYGNRSEIMLPDGSLVKFILMIRRKKRGKLIFRGKDFLMCPRVKILSSLKWPGV